jgi:hypothetical protein
VKTLKVGGDQGGVMLGPVQINMQFERVKGLFEEGREKGWKPAVG